MPVIDIDNKIVIGFDQKTIEGLLGLGRRRYAYKNFNRNLMYDLIIIGGGPGGVAAGVYAARKKIKTALVTDSFGGQSLVSQWHRKLDRHEI